MVWKIARFESNIRQLNYKVLINSAVPVTAAIYLIFKTKVSPIRDFLPLLTHIPEPDRLTS